MQKHCTACGRYISAEEMCPYCSAKATLRKEHRFMMYWALVLAVVCILLLHQLCNDRVTLTSSSNVNHRLELKFYRPT